MPTVTVLAWCLMASTGRVSSFDRRETRFEVLQHDPGVPTFAEPDLVGVERGDAQRVAEQPRPVHCGAGPRCLP